MMLLQSVLCAPDLCFKVYLIIAAGGNNDNFHYISDHFYLVDHPYSYLSEFDFINPERLVPPRLPSGLP